jgi:pimeloyl-ACP methyl ester carboxylesterase
MASSTAVGDGVGDQTACGGAGQRACCLTERPVGPSCNSGLTEVSGCEGDCRCGGANPFGISSSGTCYTLDSDGYPPTCGGKNENACTVDLQLLLGIRSCKSGLTEVGFPFGRCFLIDSAGFPDFCGDQGEPACKLLPFEHFIACKSGFSEVPIPGGTCTKLDDDGFPEWCGGEGERGCTAIPLEHIPSCKPGLGEVITGFPPTSTCIRLDEDGFPPFCGGDYERPCTKIPFEHLEACKPNLLEVARDDGSGDDECRSACGQNGQRPCTDILGGNPTCAAGLSVREEDFGVCGGDPMTWPANEATRGPARTVFLFHGIGGEFNDADPGESDILRGLFDQAKNVRQFYGVDWNNGGDPARALTTYRFFDEGCRNAGTCKRTWGAGKFEHRNFQITDVAKAAADAIRLLPTEGDITIIGGSFGGVMARQLVYRHYDELRLAGKRIAEVVTIAAPNLGGYAGALEIPGTGLLANTPGAAAELQTTFSCLPVGIDPALGFPGIVVAGQAGCQLGHWIDWTVSKGTGTTGAPWFIDDRNYPQIRWIAIAGSGRRLGVQWMLDAAQALGSFGTPFTDILERLQDPAVVPFHDSDGTITVRSALGVEADECYPFLRGASPAGGSGPDVVPTTRSYEWDWLTPGVDVIQEAMSAVCYHATARSDPRVVENAPAPLRSDDAEGHDDGFPQEMNRVVHGDMFSNAKVTSFVAAALNLYGDTNGDGVVSDADLRADAGADRTIECSGVLTPVTLSAMAGGVPVGETATYTWTGPFATSNKATDVVHLPLGTHTITLKVDVASGVSVTDQVVVVIGDTTPPILGSAIGHTIEATAIGGTPFTLSPQATDACGAVAVTMSPALAVYPLGETSVTLIATDASGNTASGNVTITVVDTTPPVIASPDNVTVEATAVLSHLVLAAPGATDIFPVTITSDGPAAFPLGDTLVTWTATDANGNSAAVTHTVTVVDTTPPVLTLPPDVTVTASGASTRVEIGLATATDIFGATVSHNAPENFPLGTTHVRWDAVDGNGNRSSRTQRIDVIYAFGGFSGPVEPGGTYRANRTMPLMFQLSFAGGISATAAVATLGVNLIGPDNGIGDAVDVDLVGADDEGNVFHFAGDHYHLNLRTHGWSAGRYRLTVRLDDGQNYSMDIVLR